MLSGLTFRRREAILGWVMASPCLLGFLAFTLGPMIASLVLSLYDWDLISPALLVGWGNYREFFVDDPLSLHSLRITLFYSLMAILLHLVLGVILAMLLNANIRGQSVIRTVYYLPAVLAGVASWPCCGAGSSRRISGC